MLDSLSAILQEFLNLSNPTQNRLWQTLFVILLLWLIRWLILRLITRQVKNDHRLFYVWRKIAEYMVVAVAATLIGRIWLESLQSFITYLGLLSAGIAIALQDLITNLAGWVFIVLRRPFTVGNRIQLGKHGGDVIDISLFQFSMLEIGNWVDADQSTGRIIHIPNNRIFKDVLANYSQGLPYIWDELPVMVTFESDWEKAKELLTAVLQENVSSLNQDALHHAQQDNPRFVIAYKNLAPTIYTKVADSGVVLTLRFLVEPRQRRGVEQAIWEATLRAFAAHDDIDFAYPTERRYVHYMENKKGPSEINEGDST